MKKPTLNGMLRPIITLLGAAIGGGLAAVGVRVYYAFESSSALETMTIVWICVGTTLVFAFASWLLSGQVLGRVRSFSSAVEHAISEWPILKILGGTLGLVVGLCVAALVSPLFRGLPELLWSGVSAAIYLTLGYLGASLGMKRWRELPAAFGGKVLRSERSAPGQVRGNVSKILDTSVIIDGRIFDVCRIGFMEGPLIIPQFVLKELRHIADSSDPLRRNRGRRGLDVLARMQKELDMDVRITDRDFDEVEEVDVKLLRLARESEGMVVTNDYNLNKVAGVMGVRVLNVNELAGSLRLVLLPGEEISVQIVREGKEYGQGVGYLDDGTMIVVDNGKRHVGETVDVVVTTVLQTSAGRMIFTRIKQAA